MGKRTILVLGGVRGLQAVLAVTLGDRFLVTTASTGAEGLFHLTASRPDLVILDASLPDLDTLTALRAVRALCPESRVLVLIEPEETNALAELLTAGVDGLFPREHHLDALFHRIETVLGGSANGARRSSRRRRRDPRVGEVIRYVAANCEDHLRVHGVAAALGLSRAHLADLFRRETGMSVKQYVTRVRVEIIKRLLVETNDTLEVIAEQVGFCDASHLSRAFRRICRCAPGEYRRQAPDHAFSWKSGLSLGTPRENAHQQSRTDPPQALRLSKHPRALPLVAQ